ncbi:GNAT family N-acetyltransferase [Cyanobacterium aponinum FACHB-4101]|nr:GNAT family N-acetyltransferase [Cyanobacterium aponinum]MBD2395620.1 GNAT family N-acetyltransferase [Cyanobacterium aponinum FACHB-4101]
MWKIREYRESDLLEVLAIWETASKLAHPFLSQSFMAKELNDITNIYLPIALTWIAEEKKEVIGFISLIDCEIGGIFVKPNFHKLGVGKSLMAQAKNKCQCLTVKVFKDNYIGLNFYLKCGFKKIAENIHQETGHQILELQYFE